MTKEANKKTNYGNWVPKKFIYAPTILGLIFLLATYLVLLLVVLSILCFFIAAYFAYAHYLFSSKGKKIQDQIWEKIVANLEWEGEGKGIDIGCGNGALSIKITKKLSHIKMIGIDYWGAQWEYSKGTCEHNAKVEGVSDKTDFQKASASKLPFEDEYFDIAVSNFCFHEVKDVKDKKELIREGLRVLKKGGKFVFQDLFLVKQIYGDPEELLATIKSWGISKIELIETCNSSFIPKVLKLPFMVGKIAIIKGIK